MIWIIQTQRKVCRPGWRRSAAPWVESAWSAKIRDWQNGSTSADPRDDLRKWERSRNRATGAEGVQRGRREAEDARHRVGRRRFQGNAGSAKFFFFFIRRRFWCKYWAQVKERIEMEILERCYKRDLIKRDCWDSLKVKDRAVKVWKAFSSHLQMTWGVWLIRACQFQAFHTEHEVTNYPLKERPQAEFGALQRVENKRRAEQAVSATLSS